jgi:hypothetical protein
MKKYLLYGILLILLFDCQKKDKFQEARIIYNQTIELHDIVMPMMPELRIIRNSLKNKRDSISNKEFQSRIDSTLQNMDSTYNDMIDWMKNIQPLPDKDNIEVMTPNQPVFNPDPTEMYNLQMISFTKIKELKKRTEGCIKYGKQLLDSIQISTL